MRGKSPPHPLLRLSEVVESAAVVGDVVAVCGGEPAGGCVVGVEAVGDEVGAEGFGPGGELAFEGGEVAFVVADEGDGEAAGGVVGGGDEVVVGDGRGVAGEVGAEGIEHL